MNLTMRYSGTWSKVAVRYSAGSVVYWRERMWIATQPAYWWNEPGEPGKQVWQMLGSGA